MPKNPNKPHLFTAKAKILFVLFFILIILLTKIIPGSWNDESRIATIDTLIREKTFAIDTSEFATTGDKVFVNDHFYSDKPPLLSVIGGAIYAPFYLAGGRLHKGIDLNYFYLTLLTAGLSWFLCLIFFYLALKLTSLSDNYRLLLAGALGAGTVFLPFSMVFNNHSIAGALIFIGFYLILKAKNTGKSWQIFLAGFLLSLAGAIDIPTMIFYAGFLIYLIWQKSLRRQIIFYLLPLLLTVLPTILINYKISDSAIPLQMRQDLYYYPSSPWLESSEKLSGVSTNSGFFILKYALNSLIGSRGFLIYNPLLFIAGYYLFGEIAQKKQYWKEAIVIAIATILLMGYYFLTTSNYGGYSFSIRWFVPLIPIIFFFAFRFFEKPGKIKTAVFAVLLTVSIGIALVGAINPWSDPTFHPIPLLANIKQLVESKIPACPLTIIYYSWL